VEKEFAILGAEFVLREVEGLVDQVVVLVFHIIQIIWFTINFPIRLTWIAAAKIQKELRIEN
jgi:hypothetical protein